MGMTMPLTQEDDAILADNLRSPFASARGEVTIKSNLKSCGKNVIIDDLALLINPEKIEICDNVRIDAFTKIVGGQRVILGNHVHIASFCSIMGGGICIIDDFSTLSYGCRIITGGDNFLGYCMTNPTVPTKYRVYRKIGKVIINKHCILGTNTIVHCDVELGEGTATGSGTIVTKSLPEWKIWIGAPAKFHKERRKDIILAMEKELKKPVCTPSH
jgi:galactoside O-acetyltransferase